MVLLYKWYGGIVDNSVVSGSSVVGGGGCDAVGEVVVVEL